MADSRQADMSRLVVALRTHVWNEDIAKMARRARHFLPGVRFVVLMDETKGVMTPENFVKLAHDSDFSGFGMPAYPKDRLLWYNSDYPLYRLRQAYPDATHYAMIEYDVAVNTDLTPVLKTAQAEAVDLIAHNICDSDPSWHWHDTVVTNYARPMRAFIPFMVASARAIDMMQRERERLAAKRELWEAKPRPAWPFCEAFIPSVVVLLENASLRNLSDFVELPYFSTRPEQHADDPAMMMPGTLCHPVVGGELFLQRRLRDVRFADIAEPRGWLLRQLAFCDPAKFVEPLFRAVKLENSLEKVQIFLKIAEMRRWKLRSPFGNLAFMKPALMSSAWRGGPAPDLARLAAGGNNGVVTGGFGFHTDLEDAAWWQVDLGRACEVTKIVIYNRLDQAARCRNLRVTGSMDGQAWRVLGEKRDDALFGGGDGRPLAFTFKPAANWRYIRLTNLERNFFHLDEVQIFGEMPA